MGSVALLLISSTLWGQNYLHFFDLEVIPNDTNQRVGVLLEPVPLVSIEQIKAEPSQFPKGLRTMSFDGPLRQAAHLLYMIDRHRDKIFEDPLKKPFYFIDFTFSLTTRQLTGKKVDENQITARIGLGKGAGKGIVSSPAGKQEFHIPSLLEEAAYGNLLRLMTKSFHEEQFKIPDKRKPFFADLYYIWPVPSNDLSRRIIRAQAPQLLFWDHNDVDRHRVHLATTYCEFKGEGFFQEKSQHLSRYRDSIESFSKATEDLDSGKVPEAIAGFRTHLEQSPANALAISRLARAYSANRQYQRAYNLLRRNNHFFTGDGELRSFYEQVGREVNFRREKLLDRRHSFQERPQLDFHILSPANKDLVAGELNLDLALNHHVPLLRIEYLLNGQPVGQIDQSPFQVKVAMPSVSRHHDLEVLAFFEDETFVRRTRTFKSVPLGDLTAVNLVSIRAVVNKGTRKILRDLDEIDFMVIENESARPITRFKRSTAPLRVAIVMDASISMLGTKLYQAQYAVNRFIRKLAPEDLVSVYTFDHKVLRLTEFTNNYEDVVGRVQTLSPNLSTALHDAMFVAHDSLRDERGTRVMILVSDGRDTASLSQAPFIRDMIEASPTLVYSIILRDENDQDRAGQKAVSFLKEISAISGSVATDVYDLNRLDHVFSRIYEELKSFYILQFYTRHENIHEQNLRLVVKRANAKARFRPFLGNLDELFEQ